MTNDLSKQLCKLCGIEPKVGICIREINLNDYVECGFYNPTEYECYDCTNFEKDAIIYPDFTKPENFVKLIELNIAGNTLWELVEQFSLEFLTDRKMFLEILLRTLNNIDLKTKFVDCQETIIKSIKQAIKNTKWNYG